MTNDLCGPCADDTHVYCMRADCTCDRPECRAERDFMDEIVGGDWDGE